MERFKQLWCKLFHNALMWPMHGKVTCKICLITHKVGW
jgi:hypothetical protein